MEGHASPATPAIKTRASRRCNHSAPGPLTFAGMATDPIYVSEEAARRMNMLMQRAERQFSCTPSCRADKPDRHVFRFLIMGIAGDARGDNQTGAAEIDLVGWSRLIEDLFGRTAKCLLSQPFGHTKTVMCVVVPRDMATWELRTVAPPCAESSASTHPIFVAEEAARRVAVLQRSAGQQLSCAPSCRADTPDRQVFRFILSGIASDTQVDNRIGLAEIDVMGWRRLIEGLFGEHVKCRLSQPRIFETTTMCIVVSRDIETWAACDLPTTMVVMEGSQPRNKEQPVGDTANGSLLSTADIDYDMLRPPPYTIAVTADPAVLWRRACSGMGTLLGRYVPMVVLVLAMWYAACTGANISPWDPEWIAIPQSIATMWPGPGWLFPDGPVVNATRK